MSYVIIQNGSKRFGDLELFNKLDLEIKKPGLYFINGESGCGKSTLLNIIAGLDHLSSGKLMTSGSIAMIFQEYELIEELDVSENIFYKRKDHLTNKERALLDHLGIASFIDHEITESSFGQRQRIGIARALNREPAIVLCDEPTESLDVQNKDLVMRLLKDYSKEHIVIIVSHDQDLTNKYADAIYVFKERQIIKHKEKLPYSLGLKRRSSKARPELAYITFKISYLRSLVFMVLFVVMCVGLFLLVDLKKELFTIPSSTKAIIADYIYIDRSLSLNDIKSEYSSSAIVLPDIKSVMIEGIPHNVDVYPFHENDEVTFDGEMPHGDKVVINDLFDDLDIGDKVSLQVDVQELTFSFLVEVAGIVHEPDATYQALYYDYDSLMDIMTLHKYLNEDGIETDVATEVLLYPTLFEADVGYERIAEGTYDDDRYVKNPLYELRKIAAADLSTYSMIFNIGLSIYVAFMMICAWYLIKKETKKAKKSFIIMRSVLIDTKKVIALYRLYKIISIYLVIILVVFSVAIIDQIFDIILTQVEILVLFGTLSLFSLYLMALYIIFTKDDRISSETLKKNDI